ncbi:cytochrome c oxidase subunit 6B2 isoform X2 [Ischnura elegans]|nr:cytochrome c oxidase subunit 6B2 isoform X2 [Ischnura elegans]
MQGQNQIKLETAPFDPRFPNQNQTRYCYQSYVDFHRCSKLKGEGYEPCNYFKKVYRTMCPAAWVEKWDTQIEEGRFPGRI